MPIGDHWYHQIWYVKSLTTAAPTKHSHLYGDEPTTSTYADQQPKTMSYYYGSFIQYQYTYE